MLADYFTLGIWKSPEEIIHLAARCTLLSPPVFRAKFALATIGLRLLICNAIIKMSRLQQFCL